MHYFLNIFKIRTAQELFLLLLKLYLKQILKVKSY